MDAHGLKGVCFVDPMPALVYGNETIFEAVETILKRGHDVQLHIHTEWLEWTKASPVAGRTGRNLADFSRADQETLLRTARDLIIAAGAPSPVALRAGNHGANDDSLAALGALGFAWDSSFNADYAGAITVIAERRPDMTVY
jgi:peptidoglycan/xylan/chitin deacetylase (PgdA/CDA1 family)